MSDLAHGRDEFHGVHVGPFVLAVEQQDARLVVLHFLREQLVEVPRDMSVQNSQSVRIFQYKMVSQ